MKKIFTIFTAMALVCIFEACSKKDSTNPLSQYTGLWTGRYTTGSTDSLAFNLTIDGLVKGRDVTYNDTLNGKWFINNNKLIMEDSIPNDNYHITFNALARSDSLIGDWKDGTSSGKFLLAKKK